MRWWSGSGAGRCGCRRGIDQSLSEGSVYIPFNQPGMGAVGNSLDVGVSVGEPS